MARIFIGDPSRVDDEVLAAVKRLPDDFWVFAEFSIGRNVDWFVVRGVPDDQIDTRRSTTILVEFKRLQNPIYGTSIHSSWQERDSTGQWREIVCSNDRDRNYYWQAVNTANELSRWLWNQHPLFLSSERTAAAGDFKVWPDLLILGSSEVTRPQLPLRPETGFGQWWFNTEDWLGHVLEWFPKVGVALTASELSRLAEALRLPPLDEPAPLPARPSIEDLPLRDVVSWLQTLEHRVSELEAGNRSLNSKVEALERRLSIRPLYRNTAPLS
ncbi:MAG: hypothetical protein ACRDI2_02640 [Chloroflexota bacterium]